MMRLRSMLILPAALLAPYPVYADALLFPYVATSDTVTTIISVVNHSNSDQIFLEYIYKQNLSNTAACDSSGRTSTPSQRNDLVSFAANGEFQGAGSAVGGPLFNDPAVRTPYGNTNFSMGPVSGARRALLIVDNGDDDGEDLYGEAIILETVGGAAWGYRAFNPADDEDEEATFDASSPQVVGPNAPLGEVLDEDDDTDLAPVTLLPANQWVTRFFVTPLADTGQRECRGCSVNFRLISLFDRDGNPLPNSNRVEVVCVGGVDLEADLLPAASPMIAQGGWGFADIEEGNENAAVVIKLEFNKPGTNFVAPNPANSFTGTVNNAVWLTHARTLQGTSGIRP